MKLFIFKILRFIHLISKNEYNDIRQIEFIKKSNLFDEKWYLDNNPDVKDNKKNAVEHYVKFGWKEGRNPNPNFDGNKYLKKYPELKDKNWCPLFHLIKDGHLKNTEPQKDKTYREKIEENLLNFDEYPPIKIDNHKRKPSFNILLPTIRKSTLTAGSLGILYFGKFLWKKGYNVRFLLTENMHFDIDALKTSSGLEELPDNVEFEALEDRKKCIFINDNDIFVATLWNTAYLAKYFQSFCKNKKFIYMIQDYEPIFYPNSSISAIIDNTYDMNFNAMFSTKILKDFFIQEKIGNIENKSYETFDTAAIANLPEYNEFKNNRETKKRFVFYGRPKRDRNMFDLGIYVIIQAIEQGILNKKDWDFYSVGAKERTLYLSNGVKMHALLYMSVEEYKKWITGVDVGLSLMLSPHPSMVPIDLSLSGAIVVTNTYKNKDEKELKNICNNIIAGKPSVDSLLQKLRQAVSMVEDYDTRYKNAKASNYCNCYDNIFNDKHWLWIKKLYDI